MYMDTPATLGRYDKAMASKKKELRKMVLLVGGATCLHRVSKDLDRFDSVLVFDTLENLHVLSEDLPEFRIADAELEGGHYVSKSLTPSQISDLVGAPGKPENLSFLQRVVNTLGKRKPSVLETTSRMPSPEAIPHSGVQMQLSNLKRLLDEDEKSKVDFTTVLEVYCKYLFRIIPRSKVTSTVTKKLPKDLKEMWDNVLQFAKSDVGLRMAKAFEAICQTKDPDFRGAYAMKRFGILSYAGDFTYLTAVFPPASVHEFLPELGDVDVEGLETKGTFKP